MVPAPKGTNLYNTLTWAGCVLDWDKFACPISGSNELRDKQPVVGRQLRNSVSVYIKLDFLLIAKQFNVHFWNRWFYSGSYPPNCWGGFYTCADTKHDTELAKRALLEEKQEKHLGRWHPYLPTKTELATQKGAGETDTLEPHKTGRNRPRAASCWSQREQGLKTKLPLSQAQAWKGWLAQRKLC